MSSRVRIVKSDWANLSDELLQSALEKLEILPSFLRFSKNNRSLAKKLPSPPPVLLINSGIADAWNVYDILNNKVLDLQINLQTKGVIVGSSKGWVVILERDFSVTLVNAFSRIFGREEKQNSTIRLPPLPSYSDNLIGSVESFECETLLNKVFISADPIEEAEDCVVVVTHQRISRVSFIRLGKDITWTTSICFAIEQVVCSGDQFYGVGYSSRILSFDTSTFTRSTDSCVKEFGPRGKLIKRYILGLDEKKLVMVQRYMIRAGAIYVTEKFKVFELSFDGCEWEEKISLGDAAFFVGNMNTVSVLASSFPGCQQDCIYFNHDNNYLADHDVKYFTISSSYDDYGVYNMQTKSISKPFSQDAVTLVEKTKWPPVWVVPTFQL